MHNFLFYTLIICLYMFRTQSAHHQEVKIVLYSIWYHHTCQWPSRAQVERGVLGTGRPLTGVMIPDFLTAHKNTYVEIRNMSVILEC